MTNRLLLFCALMILAITSYSQQRITGTIIDEKTGNHISFASIGLFRSNTGVTANKDGYFSIYTSSQLDTLIFSCVGYSEKRIAVNQTTGITLFRLAAVTPKLEPVFVHSKPLTILTLNDFTNCGNDSYTTSGNVIQIAQLFEDSNARFKLIKLNVCKWRGNSIFRIRIYGYDSLTGKPSGNLTDSIIEISSSAKKISVNLSEYNIWVTDCKFFVAVEWLEIPYNSNNSKSNYGANKLYNPFLSITKRNKTNFDDNSKLWFLSYKRVWQRLDNSIASFLIAVDIGY